MTAPWNGHTQKTREFKEYGALEPLLWWICGTGVRGAAAAYASRGAGAAWGGSGACCGENAVSGLEVVMGTLELEF